MFSVDYNSKFASIKLNPGINVFEPESATGKSFLPIYLRNFSDAPTIISIDTKKLYDNWVNGIFNKKDTSVIYFFDRSDLFMSDSVREELLLLSHLTVLIDSKNYIFDTGLNNVTIIEIIMKENYIEVHPLC